jgi:hypothetical protein
VLQVFTTKRSFADLIRYIFGGNIYVHKVGWLWVTGNRMTLCNIAKEIKELLPIDEEGQRVWPEGLEFLRIILADRFIFYH